MSSGRTLQLQGTHWSTSDARPASRDPEITARRKPRMVEHQATASILMSFSRSSLDNRTEGWAQGRTEGWDVGQQILEVKEAAGRYDFIRHLVTSRGDDAGWTVLTDSQWRNEKITTIKDILVSRGAKK